MRKSLLILGVWIASLSFALAANEPLSLPSFNKYLITLEQEAPVYPNPAHDHIFFRFTNAVQPTDNDLTIEIRNILGNKMPVRLERTANDTYRISLTNYPSGYYMLVLQCERCDPAQGGHEEIHKFLKQ